MLRTVIFDEVCLLWRGWSKASCVQASACITLQSTRICSQEQGLALGAVGHTVHAVCPDTKAVADREPFQPLRNGGRSSR